MTALVDSLVAQAFDRASVTEANQAIDAARARYGGDGGPATSYEIALPGFDIDTFLTGRALPKLIYFLDCRGERPPAAPTTFVSLFTPTGLFFIDAGAVALTLGAALGLSPAELVRRYGERGTGDPKRLGA
ncbi:MAG: hypothetical protein JNG84_10455 [Archangium sp.]|nr:hypothetical protein [Archangium sp.]